MKTKNRNILILAILIYSTCGYGLYLSDDKFLKFYCVLVANITFCFSITAAGGFDNENKN